MASTVGIKPNHYDTLGVAPTASEADIAEAFAREIAAPRAFGGLAQVGIAYAVLRDPAKRRAYDEALGLRREPVRRAPPPAVSFRGSAHFMAEAAPVAEAPVKAQSEKPAEQRTGSFIAASLREVASPEPRADVPVAPQPRPEPVRPPQADAAPNVEQLIERLHSARSNEQPVADETGERPFGWSRTGAAVGALLLCAAVVGGWAGLSAGGAQEPKAAKPAARVALSPPQPFAQPLPSVPAATAAQPAPPVAAAGAPRLARSATPRHVVPTERLAEISRSLDSAGYYGGATAGTAAEPTTVVETPAAAPAAEAVQASMPLPNAVIARTIGRIGYACGSVASTTALEPGVFKVTCSSGQTYRASPVGGRYHFKRLSQ